MKRLPIVLSVTALVLAVMGVTPLGQATRDALPLAKNADRVDQIHASKTPKAGQLYPLGRNARFPAAVLSVRTGPKGAAGPVGPQGPQGPQGPSGVQSVQEVINWTQLGPQTRGYVTATCPPGKKPISGGGASPKGYIVFDAVSSTYDGWTIGGYNPEPTATLLFVSAYCSPNVDWTPMTPWPPLLRTSS